jgi:hypothetical protein
MEFDNAENLKEFTNIEHEPKPINRPSPKIKRLIIVKDITPTLSELDEDNGELDNM